MTNEKLTERTTQLAKFAADAVKDGAREEEIYSLIADCRNSMTRARNRAKAADPWERVEFVPTRGATVEFTGRLLAKDAFDTRGENPLKITMEIWETQGGALVAVDETNPLFERSTPKLAVKVCPPTGDAQEQRFAVMEHFGWSSRARSMARKLGWSLRVEVE